MIGYSSACICAFSDNWVGCSGNIFKIMNYISRQTFNQTNYILVFKVDFLGKYIVNTEFLYSYFADVLKLINTSSILGSISLAITGGQLIRFDPSFSLMLTPTVFLLVLTFL